MKSGRQMGIIGAVVLGTLGAGGWQSAEAQLTRVRPAEAPTGRPVWHGTMAGWQVGMEGEPGAHQWHIDRDGRGTITWSGPPRTGGRRTIEQSFALTVPEHVRFSGLIERFTSAPDALPCATDYTQDIIRWSGGTRSDGVFNFDHSCRSEARDVQLALLTEALGVLRQAAVRGAS